MLTVQKTDVFQQWIDRLRDIRAKAIILRRIDRLVAGNPGDVRPVGRGVSELRIDYGPGYRVYYVEQGGSLIILLCGGDKSTQGRDIGRANIMNNVLRETKS